MSQYQKGNFQFPTRPFSPRRRLGRQRDRLPHHIAVSSDKFFELWTQKEEVVDFFGHVTTLGGPISFAYIDGDHTYEQSWRDFQNVDRFLLPGGFIVFDDSADDCEWESRLSRARGSQSRGLRARRQDAELLYCQKNDRLEPQRGSNYKFTCKRRRQNPSVRKRPDWLSCGGVKLRR
jgi:hypothetical protein